MLLTQLNFIHCHTRPQWFNGTQVISFLYFTAWRVNFQNKENILRESTTAQNQSVSYLKKYFDVFYRNTRPTFTLRINVPAADYNNKCKLQHNCSF